MAAVLRAAAETEYVGRGQVAVVAGDQAAVRGAIGVLRYADNELPAARVDRVASASELACRVGVAPEGLATGLYDLPRRDSHARPLALGGRAIAHSAEGEATTIGQDLDKSRKINIGIFQFEYLDIQI